MESGNHIDPAMVSSAFEIDNYTHAMPANIAVPWAGFFNFVGVLVSAACFFFGMLIAVVVQHPLW